MYPNQYVRTLSVVNPAHHNDNSQKEKKGNTNKQIEFYSNLCHYVFLFYICPILDCLLKNSVWKVKIAPLPQCQPIQNLSALYQDWSADPER